MKKGRASHTSELVCQGRAVADRQHIAGFRDATAYTLLPAQQRALVDRYCSGERPRAGEGFQFGRMRTFSVVSAVRSVAIDEAVERSQPQQLVILGAGLDGRAYRMAALRDCVVYEVDHPDTQRDKRERVGALTPTAREIHFVPVDFTRDSLEVALQEAGHDPTRPTTWIWEGVVMYLTPAQVDVTLQVIARRSAPASTLLLLYSHPSFFLMLVGLFVRAVGEPFRSAYRVPEMAALLERHGFVVREDADIAELGGRLGPPVARQVRFMHHLRFVNAQRV